MRVLRPAPEVYAFYAGRDGELLDAGRENWVDLGALSLGVASYAIVDGPHALVYDTHVSVWRTRGRCVASWRPRACASSRWC